MNKRLSTVLLSFLLCVILLAATISETYAQTPTGNTGVVTLADLGKTDVSLNGPFDTSTLSFGLPSDWKFTGGARIDLNITTALDAISQGGTSIGGTLIVSFNRTIVTNISLNQVGTFDYTVDVPPALLVSPRADGLMELKFTLNSGISCVANQRMNVIINATSRISFPYEEQKVDTSLSNFPRPIVQSSIFPDKALIVIPDNPSAMELQSAFTVASGLGNLSANKLVLDLVTVSKLTGEQKAATHLIFVGKAASIPTLTELTLPLKVQNGAFIFTGGNQDNGVIEMVNSPWAVRDAILVVSGNTDLGTLKAAQAVSTGVFQENSSPNLAIVESIQDKANTAPLIEDQTLADLGYSAQQFNNRGIDSQSYKFYLPSGSTLTTDAYFELAYGHSALLNYNISGIVVLLNGQPIGSVRFNDASAGQAINRVRIAVPPSVVIPGYNTIEIRASLEPLDNCTDPNLHGLWAVAWPDSRLHLPFTSSQLNTQLAVDLSAYPAPMIFDSTLGTTAVVIQRNDLESWRTFIRVASYLGERSNGPIVKIAVFFDDGLSNIDLSKYNLIVVGQPSRLAIMDKLNASLPVPFEKGSNIPQGKFSQVSYEISPDIPIGYVELMPSPWNSEKVLIAAFGNTVTGVNWGISALVDSILRSQLAGDFAVINNTRVQTVDTRLVVAVANTPIAENPSVLLTPVPQTNSAPLNSRSSWLLPMLVLTIILIVVVIVVAIFLNLRSTRKNG